MTIQSYYYALNEVLIQVYLLYMIYLRIWALLQPLTDQWTHVTKWIRRIIRPHKSNSFDQICDPEHGSVEAGQFVEQMFVRRNAYFLIIDVVVKELITHMVFSAGRTIEWTCLVLL